MEDNNKFETEIDFKKLIKSPSRLFGWYFVYFTVLILLLGIYFVKNVDKISLNNVPAIYTDSLSLRPNVENKMGGMMPAVDLALISNPTNEFIEKGKKLFQTNCSSCHGNEGKGDGVAAAALEPKPRNLHQIDGWKNGREFKNLFLTLQKGIAGSGMVAYDFIPVSDRIAIIQYIRTFENYPVVSLEEINEIDNTYQLSKGKFSPNNIPLEKAAEKIIAENKIDDEKIKLANENINLYPNKNITDLFFNSVISKEKVFSIFSKVYLNKNDVSSWIEGLSKNPVEHGFSAKVSLLTNDELVELYQFLKKVLS